MQTDATLLDATSCLCLQTLLHVVAGNWCICFHTTANTEATSSSICQSFTMKFHQVLLFSLEFYYSQNDLTMVESYLLSIVSFYGQISSKKVLIYFITFQQSDGIAVRICCKWFHPTINLSVFTVVVLICTCVHLNHCGRECFSHDRVSRTHAFFLCCATKKDFSQNWTHFKYVL